MEGSVELNNLVDSSTKQVKYIHVRNANKIAWETLSELSKFITKLKQELETSIGVYDKIDCLKNGAQNETLQVIM